VEQDLNEAFSGLGRILGLENEIGRNCFSKRKLKREASSFIIRSST
jgi:hypothetical protein